MNTLRKKLHSNKSLERTYNKFNQINGKHPLQDNCENSYIQYKVRKRKGGKLAYFNFELAKEMGLIPKNHPEELTEELKEKFLETFSIVIINEYDIVNNVEFDEEDILPNKYMATRYLQLQHPNKFGKTSGDGRSIWNGDVSYRGKLWDVSSCGTGATRLSPATHLENKFFQTGDPSISYGCGYSEIDEGFATSIFSEILRKNGMVTERVLGIIEFENNLSINVRAHSNLLRPSHMFGHLKQGNFDNLKAIVNYFIDRQEKCGDWQNVPKSKSARYRYFVRKEIEIFAKLSADFEDDYIFCWLDWDGDNILMDGGIIDYGSVRQFGLYHHEYRYDDVQRYSTSIKEQKEKSKHIAKTLLQIGEYLTTKVKGTLKDFDNHTEMLRFEEIFEKRKNENLLKKIGFSTSDRTYLLKEKTELVTLFRSVFSYFEKAKSSIGIREVADGISWDAIFCMRDILRELPQIYSHREEILQREEFIEILKSSYAVEEDLQINNYRAKKIDEFQEFYMDLIGAVSKKYSRARTEILLEITMRSSIINKYDRVTGDSITKIVEKVLKVRKRLTPEQLYEIMQEFSEYQNLDPDKRSNFKISNSAHPKEIKSFLKIVRDFREGI